MLSSLQDLSMIHTPREFSERPSLIHPSTPALTLSFLISLFLLVSLTTYHSLKLQFFAYLFIAFIPHRIVSFRRAGTMVWS